MLTQEHISYIIGISTILTFGVTLYNSLKKPQEKSEIKEAVFDEKLKNIQINNDIKNKEIKDVLINLRDNHLAHLDAKLDKHIEKQIEQEQLSASNFTKTFTLLDIIMKQK